MKLKASSLFFWIAVCSILLTIGALAYFNQTSFNNSKPMPLLTFPITHVTTFTIEDFTRGLKFTQAADGAWHVAPEITALQKQLDPQNQLAQPSPPKKADREKIITYLTELSLIKVQTPVATQTKPETFKINPMSLRITFYDASNTVLGGIFIGKKGLEQISTYVMRANTAEVYWISQDIRSQALMPLEFWLETNNP